METNARKFSGLASCILAIVAALACGPAQTPGGPQSTPMPTTAASSSYLSAVEDSRLVELLEKMPLSIKERGLWFGDNERALELANAPQPRSLEEIRALGDAEVEDYVNAVGNVVQAAGFGRFQGQPQEWIDTFGLDYFGIARGARTGGDSRHPHVLAYVEGDFDAVTVRQKLLALEYERREAAGLAYYAVPKGFHRLSNPVSRLTINRMDHVFIGEGVLMAAPGANKLAEALVDALKVRVGTAPSMADDPPVLGVARSLGDPVSAVILTRPSVLEPGYLPALFYDKPSHWGTLNEWELFAVGYGVSGTDRLLNISLYYPDPAHAAEDAGELEQRILSYFTIVPQLVPGASPQLAAGWPEKPYAQMCGPLISSVSNPGIGSILTVRCPIKNGINWWQLIDLRDLGFLLP